MAAFRRIVVSAACGARYRHSPKGGWCLLGIAACPIQVQGSSESLVPPDLERAAIRRKAKWIPLKKAQLLPKEELRLCRQRNR